jgi:hypothetical protein
VYQAAKELEPVLVVLLPAPQNEHATLPADDL